MNWFISVIKRPLDFQGRARRKEFWHFFVISLLIAVVLSVIDNALGWYDSEAAIGILSGTFSLLIMLPNLSVTVRRLHDSGKSGWWALLYIVPLLGFLILLILLALDGDSETNKYGEAPKRIGLV